MSFRCESVEQITMFLENRPGILADLCAHLTDHAINIRALGVLDNADTGLVRLVADDAVRTRKTLSEAGIAYTSTQCLAIEMPNNPGGFAGIARTLTLAGINIDYMYASAVPGAPTALGILHVSSLERALSLDWEG
jgi:hypothetical protein